MKSDFNFENFKQDFPYQIQSIRNPSDYKKNSNYRDFELSRSLFELSKGKKKIRIIKSFYYIFENMYELT